MSVADVPNSLYELSSLIHKAEAVAACLAEGVGGMLCGSRMDKDASRCDWLAGVLCDLLDQSIRAVSRAEGEIVHRSE